METRMFEHKILECGRRRTERGRQSAAVRTRRSKRGNRIATDRLNRPKERTNEPQIRIKKYTTTTTKPTTTRTTNFEQSLTLLTWLRSARNFAKIRFRRSPTCHVSSPKQNNQENRLNRNILPNAFSENKNAFRRATPVTCTS